MYERSLCTDASRLTEIPVQQNTKVGDVRYRDANGDGVISDSDRTIDGET